MYQNSVLLHCQGHKRRVHVPSNCSLYEKAITTIALNIPAEAAVEQKAEELSQATFALDWLNVGGKNRRTSRSLHFICKIVDDGAKSICKALEVL